MKDFTPAYLVRALGSLPEHSKAAFINDALRTLHELQAAHAASRPMPPKADRVALTRVGILTARLIDAINGAQESESATMLLRDAWLNLDCITDETVGSPMPSLQRLQRAVEFCLPEKKRIDRPVEKSPASSLAIVALADHFRRHFGRRPTFGTGSPFVTFLREALPAYGLYVPSVVGMRKIAAGG